ncbi:hypothetical protein D3C87_1301510 [compost metagenome]
MGALQQTLQLFGAQRVGRCHDDPLRPRQIRRRMNARAVAMTEKQILVDLERQGIATQVLQGEHLVPGNRKHPHATPFVIFPCARQGQAKGRDIRFAHAS